MIKKWIFVIDTDSYAGNFERDMCAYLTGIVGDCEIGNVFAELFHEECEVDFSEYLEKRPDEYGVFRPTSLWPTKGWLSMGFNKAVRDNEWNQEEADKIYQEGMAEHYRKYLKNAEAIQVGTAGHTEDTKAQAIEQCKKDIERALKRKCPKTNPNNSVAIFFSKKPTLEQINLMKKRAFVFAEAKRKRAKEWEFSWEENFKLAIHGFRLITETITEDNENV